MTSIDGTIHKSIHQSPQTMPRHSSLSPSLKVRPVELVHENMKTNENNVTGPYSTIYKQMHKLAGTGSMHFPSSLLEKMNFHSAKAMLN